MQVLIFGAKDDPDAGWARAVHLAASLQQQGVSAQLIQKNGFVLEDLHLVARYSVVSTPTVLMLQDERITYRKLGVPATCALLDIIQAQTSVTGSGA